MLQLNGRILAKDDLLDTDLRHIRIVDSDGGAFLYAATGQNGGLSVYRINGAGRLASLHDSTYFTVSGMGVGPFSIVRAVSGDRLVLSGVGDGALVGYAIKDDGSLAALDSTDLPGRGVQTPAAVASYPLTGGRDALYMVDADSGRIAAWLTDGKGRITAEAGLKGRASDYALTDSAQLTVAQVGDAGFLLAAEARSHGVSSYAIDAATGALRRVDALGAADGLGVATPTGLQTVTAHGATWVVLAAADSNSLSVLRVSANGTLTATDHILDTRATRFGGVVALEVIKADGHVFVLAGGADDGLSLFSLLPDGKLIHLQTLEHSTGLGLDNVTGIEAFRTGDEIQIFVASGGDKGLSQFSLDLTSLGEVLQAKGVADGGTVAGTAGSDVIMGQAGRSVLIGKAGDDILVSGDGGAVLTGGAGNDTFVLGPTSDSLRIMDFEPGIDRLDLSLFPMLRSVSQLKLEPIANGIWVKFAGTEIKVLSADGKPLSAKDLWPGGFDGPDRIDVSATLTDPNAGTPGDDVLTLGAGPDTVQALGGDDVVSGGGGRDRLRGGAGDDRLDGGLGNDLLIGGGGDDTLLGDGGRDRLKGRLGDDHLDGGPGNDRLVGGLGNDLLIGGGGDDTLLGGGGRDRLRGGAGDDRLDGGLGNDLLIAGPGNDRLSGGGGGDRFFFGEDHGDDTITDFSLAEDRIRFNISGLSFESLDIRAVEDGTEIDTGAGTIILEGVDPGDLGAEHFLFS